MTAELFIENLKHLGRMPCTQTATVFFFLNNIQTFKISDFDREEEVAVAMSTPFFTEEDKVSHLIHSCLSSLFQWLV